MPHSVTYDVARNRLIENANGALTVHNWDSENGLQYTQPSQILTFSYFADGKWHSRQQLSQTGDYMVPGDDVLLEKMSSNGGIAAYNPRYPGTWGETMI